MIFKKTFIQSKTIAIFSKSLKRIIKICRQRLLFFDHRIIKFLSNVRSTKNHNEKKGDIYEISIFNFSL